jgi:hypothetical protein
MNQDAGRAGGVGRLRVGQGRGDRCRRRDTRGIFGERLLRLCVRRCVSGAARTAAFFPFDLDTR